MIQYMQWPQFLSVFFPFSHSFLQKYMQHESHRIICVVKMPPNSHMPHMLIIYSHLLPSARRIHASEYSLHSTF